MAVFRCKMCGGTVEFEQGSAVGVCDSCGTKQTLPKNHDDLIANLFNRANNLRMKCEFDKAMQAYEKIVETDDSEAEAHWGIVLCKYGIEYVEDPKTGNRVPTCHRTLFEAVTTDADYLAAIDYSNAIQQQIYEKEARAIDRIQKDILAIVKNEKPFDIFICYKETDDSGKRTIDSTIANDIYYELNKAGFKVFFAAITLEDKLGQEYEPYIFAALNSAKVMLVLGTKPEYFSAVWVKNEWSRFLKLMKSDRSKLLIPCYRDMDAYDLPEEFAHLQAQDMSKIGFINDVVRGIEKVVKKDEPKQTATVVKETVVTGGNVSAEPLLKRAFMFLEDGEWEKADEFCEQVLNLDPENARAYLGKLMAELRVKKQDDLQDYAIHFDNRNNYQKVLRFGDSNLRATMEGYITHIKTRNENTRLEGIYARGKSIMAGAKTEKEWKEAAVIFSSVKGYRDSEELAKTCALNSDTARKDAIYVDGVEKMGRDSMPDYAEAIKIFQSIPCWKDSDAQIEYCQKRYEELKIEAQEKRLELERKIELQRKKLEEIQKRNKRIVVIVSAVTAAVIAFVVVWSTYIMPNSKYNDAVSLMESGKYQDAISAFGELAGYRDSLHKIEECKVAILEERYQEALAFIESGKYEEAAKILHELGSHKDSAAKSQEAIDKLESARAEARIQQFKESVKDCKAGDIITFGAYEQDNDPANGKENIEWIVLDVEDGKALLISKYALDGKEYNDHKSNITWEECTLRNWLNNSFFDQMFSSKEQQYILSTTIPAEDNNYHGTEAGNDTCDRLFLLSETEAKLYFNSDLQRQCEPTAYAEAHGAALSFDGNCWWWLRTPGIREENAVNVINDGTIISNGYRVDYLRGVRPALWVSIEE